MKNSNKKTLMMMRLATENLMIKLTLQDKRKSRRFSIRKRLN
jgi:hypothetical protein